MEDTKKITQEEIDSLLEDQFQGFYKENIDKIKGLNVSEEAARFLYNSGILDATANWMAVNLIKERDEAKHG